MPDYTVYATIQTLLNGWRDEDRADLTRVVTYESKVVEWLLNEKEESILEEQVDSNVDSLVVKILTEKFNNAYTNRLNDEQKDIVRSYAFSISSDDGLTIRNKLEEIKEDTLCKLNSFFHKEDNVVLREKVNKIKSFIMNESIENICDQTISRFLLISHLKTELLEDTNE